MNEASTAIIRSVVYGSLATTTRRGEPWGTILRFAESDGYLYWRSQKDTIHSENLTGNPQVFITIFDTAQQLKGGVYIRSHSEILTGEEREKGLRIYTGFFEDPDKLGGDADVYRCQIGQIDLQKTEDSRFYYTTEDAE